MSVLLRNVDTGLYYRETPCWASERPDALDFKDVTRALEFGTCPGLGSLEVVLCPDGQGDIILPINATSPSDFLFFVQNWASPMA